MPTLPILPGLVQPGPIQAAAPTANVAPVDPTADPNAGAFLDQLAAALAALSPGQASPPAPAVPQDQLPEEGETGSEPSDQADLADLTDHTDQTDQTMVDLAASFGLLPMPLLMPVTTMPVVAATRGDKVSDATGMPAAAQPGPQFAAPLGQVEGSAPLASSASDPRPMADEAQPSTSEPAAETAPPSQPTTDAAPASNPPATTLPPAQGQLSVPLPPPATPVVDDSVSTARDAAPRTDKDQAPPRAADSAPGAVPMPETRGARLPEAHRESNQTREPGAPTTTTAVGHGQIVQQPASGSETHAGSDQHGHGHGARAQQDAGAATTEPASPSVSTDQTVPPAPFAAVAGMAGATAPNTANAAHPREVVAQIAQQAELYRLPGGRGVRIQLHPDGLGGVEVTLRYGAAGGLELHVNVEHAATGALVESGWSDLRAALSQQGISPDRLMMSVTGPSGASLSSSDSGGFGAGNGAGFSQDTGPSGFGQSNPQGQGERQPAPGRGRWNASVTPISHEPDNVAPASSSRIDLRV